MNWNMFDHMVRTTKMNQCNLNVWFGKYLPYFACFEHLGDAENVSNEYQRIVKLIKLKFIKKTYEL